MVLISTHTLDDEDTREAKMDETVCFKTLGWFSSCCCGEIHSARWPRVDLERVEILREALSLSQCAP